MSTELSCEYLPVVAIETTPGSGEWKLEVLRTGQPGAMAYEGSPNGDFHNVRGFNSWSALLKGNSIMVSGGTVPGPLAPFAVQLSNGEMLARLTGDVEGVRLGQLLGLSNSTLTDFYDVQLIDESGDAAAVGDVLTVDNIGTPGSPVANRFKWTPPASGGVSVNREPWYQPGSTASEVHLT